MGSGRLCCLCAPHLCLAILPPAEVVMVPTSWTFLGGESIPQPRPALRDGKGPSLGAALPGNAPVHLQKLNAFSQGPQLLG